MAGIINLPNSLSILRLLMIAPIFFLIINSNKNNYPILIISYFIALLLDFFDGYLARKLSQETELGKFLDPIADKLMIFILILALIIKAGFPIWLAFLIYFRDIVILLASFMILREKHTINPSILIGKIFFGVLVCLILIYIIDLNAGIDLDQLKRFFTILSSGFLVWTWIEYFKVFQRIKYGK